MRVHFIITFRRCPSEPAVFNNCARGLVCVPVGPISPFPIPFAVRGYRPGKSVQMSEAEVRGLCIKSREIFLQQPILLELESPLIICGE